MSDYVKRAADDIEFAIRFASIESHYFVHGGFFESDEFLIDGAKGLNGRFPITIVQGRYDIVCPAITAWELKKNLPDAELYMVRSNAAPALTAHPLADRRRRPFVHRARHSIASHHHDRPLRRLIDCV